MGYFIQLTFLFHYIQIQCSQSHVILPNAIFKALFLFVDHVKAFVSDDDPGPESMAVVKEKQLNGFKRCDCSSLTDYILDLT